MAKGEEYIMETIETKEIEKELIKVEINAIALQVTDNETYAQAGTLLIGYKELGKTIKNYFKPLKENTHKAWEVICDREKEELNKLQPGIQHLNKQMVTYNIEQEQIRKAEEDRLRDEAEKAERERRLGLVLKAVEAGEGEEAKAILEEPGFIPPPIVEKTVPKQAGLAMVTIYKWRLVDINKVPKPYLQLRVNEAAVNQTVKALKAQTNIPGIEVYSEQSMRGVRK